MAENEARPRLAVKNGYTNFLWKIAEARKPLGRSCSLPLLSAAVVTLHDICGRHADRIEIETADTGNSTGLDLSNNGGFAGARGPGYDEDEGQRLVLLDHRRNATQPNANTPTPNRITLNCVVAKTNIQPSSAITAGTG